MSFIINWHLLNIHETTELLGTRPNGTFLLQLGLIYLPFLQPIFSTQSLTIKELVICLAAAAVVFHAVEMEELVKTWRCKVIPPIDQSH